MCEFERGHIDPWWLDEHTQLVYVHETFNNDADTLLWRGKGFTQTRFTGDMYDMRFAKPAWLDQFEILFPMRHFCWSVYRMRPGDVLPRHKDTYRRFCDLHDIDDLSQIKRYVVFLEHWKSGHYFEIDDCAVTDWHAGDWVSWRGETPHIAANIGFESRYTLQLTGLIPE